MTLIAQFAGSAGPQRIRITKPTLGLVFRRTASVTAAVLGLAAAFPETISAEISHPSRRLAELGTELPQGMVALFGQYLRGPIIEEKQGNSEVYVAETYFWLNQSSAVELTSEDQCFVNFVPHAGYTYEVYAPETPVVDGFASKFYRYQLERMSSDLRQKVLATAGKTALIIPNDPDSIEKVTMTVNLDGGGQKELVYTLRELLQQAQRGNPHVVESTGTHNELVALMAQKCEYILLTLNASATVELHNVLGAQYDYMTVEVWDRNMLG